MMIRQFLGFRPAHAKRLEYVTVLAVVMLACAGCGQRRSVSVAEVSGTVTMDGKPLELIRVEFWPESGVRALGTTDDEGNFRMRLEDESKSGASVGSNRIVLQDTWPMKDDVLSDSGAWIDNSKGKKVRISSKYYDVHKTPLTFFVESGKKNVFDIEVEPRKK